MTETGSGGMSGHPWITITDEGASPQRTALLFHGILGSARNWVGTARRMARAHPDYRLVAMDFRGHGDSPVLAPPHTVAACVDDVRAMVVELGLTPDAVIGHSFGGKIALEYARRYGTGLKAVWFLDAPPGPRALASGHGLMADLFDAIGASPVPAPDRQTILTHFTDAGFPRRVGFWMTTNLRRVENGYVWKFDLDTVRALLDDYWGCDLWPFLESSDRTVPVHALLAGQSDWWRGETEKRLAACPGLQLHRLPDAGHWVHIDDPDGLLSALGTTLR